MSVQEDTERWADTRRLLRFGKRSEYLSSYVTAEEQFTRQLIAALLEFGKEVAEHPEDVQECLTEFLQTRGVETNLAPDFQWERECLKLTEVLSES